jgi:hypothetical protein
MRKKLGLYSILAVAAFVLAFALSGSVLAKRSVTKCIKSCGDMAKTCESACKKGIKDHGHDEHGQAGAKCKSMCSDVKSKCLKNCQKK